MPQKICLPYIWHYHQIEERKILNLPHAFNFFFFPLTQQHFLVGQRALEKCEITIWSITDKCIWPHVHKMGHLSIHIEHAVERKRKKKNRNCAGNLFESKNWSHQISLCIMFCLSSISLQIKNRRKKTQWERKRNFRSRMKDINWCILNELRTVDTVQFSFSSQQLVASCPLIPPPEHTIIRTTQMEKNK